MMFYCDLWKQNISYGAFLLPTLPPHLTELSKVFQAGCFNFAQMKAAELCINKLSDSAAKSELKADWERFGNELGELRTPDGLADRVSSGMAFQKGTERLANWSSRYTEREAGVNAPTTGASLSLSSLKKCTPSALWKDAAQNKKIIEPKLDGTKCGFRRGRSTTEQFYSPTNFRETLGTCQRRI